MDLWTAMRVVFRHWVIVSIGLIAAATASVATFSRIPTTYEASGRALLIDSKANVNPDTKVVGNPYLEFGKQKISTARVLTRVARGDVVRAKLRQAGARSSFEVESDKEAPILTVAAEGGDAKNVVLTVTAVLEVLAKDLQERQTNIGVPPDLQLRAEIVDLPRKANTVIKERTKSAALVGVLGALGAASLAFIVEGIQASRREREEPDGLAEVDDRGAPPGRQSNVASSVVVAPAPPRSRWPRRRSRSGSPVPSRPAAAPTPTTKPSQAAAPPRDVPAPVSGGSGEHPAAGHVPVPSTAAQAISLPPTATDLHCATVAALEQAHHAEATRPVRFNGSMATVDQQSRGAEGHLSHHLTRDP